jgi:Flp pilus assembly pilin Flp
LADLHTHFYPFRGIFATCEKEIAPASALSGIHTPALIPRGSASKGGVLHRTFLRAEGGQAAPEYALILALVTAGLILVFSSLGATTVRLVDEVITAFAP